MNFKGLVQQGKIKRNTVVIDQYGRTVRAGSILGLPFPSRDTSNSPFPDLVTDVVSPNELDDPPEDNIPLCPSISTMDMIDGMKDQEDTSRKRIIFFIVAASLVIILAIVALVVSHNREAKKRAAEAQTALPSEEEAVEDSVPLPAEESVPTENTPEAQDTRPEDREQSISELKAERKELQTILEDTTQWLRQFDIYSEQAAKVKRDPLALERLTEPKSRLWNVSYDVEAMGNEMCQQEETLKTRLKDLDARIESADNK